MASTENEASARSQLQDPSKPSLECDLKRMLKVELEDFKRDSSKCCLKFAAFYSEIYRLHIQSLAMQYNFKFQMKFASNGVKYVQIFKDNCPTYCFEDATFKLTETSQKEIFKYLSDCPLESKERLDLLPGYAKTTNLSKPRVQVYKFSIGSFQNVHKSVPPAVTSLKYTKRRMGMPIYQYHDLLLSSINQNQVTLVYGHSSIGKSTQLPQYILENATRKNEHCRIIFTHINQISAVNSSMEVATERSEFMGFAIGYQIRLESVSSSTTNLLYTTTDFFLRCLMGINSKDVFLGITHVILADCQERDHNTDLLLIEIKEILCLYPNLRIILLTNSRNFDCYREYFKQACIIELRREYHNIVTKDLPEVLELLSYTSLNQFQNNPQQKLSKSRQEFINNIIENYFDTGDANNFNEFMYVNEMEGISVNNQHSENGFTMLIAAVKNNNLDHVRKLLYKNADINLVDSNNRNAIDWAKLNCSAACTTLLESRQQNKDFQKLTDEKDQNNAQLYNSYRANRINNYMEVDYALLSKLIQYINEKLDRGTILIFLPRYTDLVKMEFYLNIYIKNVSLSQKNGVQLKVYKIYDTMQKRELDEIMQSDSTLILRKCILTTDLAESCINVNDAVYVIDSGRTESITKLNSSGCIKNLQWITQEQAEARRLIAGRYKPGYCYRFYTNSEANRFNCFIWPKLLQIPLDKVCLCVRLLSPYTLVSEYFNRLICTPKKTLIEKSIQFLRTIGVFDEQENVTTLGIRLVDIPLDLQLGKVLVYSILLRCLDPVLTIVSMLAYQDPLEIPHSASETEKIENLNYRKNLIKADSLNDLLVLIRIFQQWQDDRGSLNCNEITLEKFLLDANLLQICELRTQIVGIVRAAQLIHTQGILSMHYVNLKANKWAVVKACFVAGLYPEICRIRNGIRSREHDASEIRLSSCSVLNNNTTLNFKYKNTDYESEWLVYQDSMKLEEGYKIIKHCLPVHPLAICLFSGHLKKSSEDLRLLTPITKKEERESNVKIVKCDETDTNTSMSYYIIDDWINFILNTDDSVYIFNFRQKLSSLFTEILENCDNSDRMRRLRVQYLERLCILDTVSRVLQNEDRAWNFSKPERVGERPRALPLSSMHDIHSITPDIEIDLPTLSGPEPLSAPSSRMNTENFYIPSISNSQTNRISLSNNVALNTTQYDRDYCNNFYQASSSSWNQKPLNNNLVSNPDMYFFDTTKSSGSSDFHNTSVHPHLFNNNIKSNKPRYSNENTPLRSNYQPEPQPPSNIYMPPMVRAFQQFNMNSMQRRTMQQPILGNQSMMRRSQQNVNVKFFVLPCSNLNDTFKYFKENIWNDGTTLWDQICIQYVKIIEPSRFFVFLYDEELNSFSGCGQMVKYNYNECRLTEYVPADLNINLLKSKLSRDNCNSQAFLNSLRYGEIDTATGTILLSYIQN